MGRPMTPSELKARDKRAAAAAAAEKPIWVVALDYHFVAGAVTHVGGGPYFTSEEACKKYIDTHAVGARNYYPLRLTLHKEGDA